MIKDKFSRSGKEQYRQLDTPKTEEKTTTVNAEGNKSEAPKKKKNIIRVFHAQNASDGGKGRRKPAAGEKKGPARSQNGGQRPAGQGTRNNESGEQRNSQGGANRTQGGRPQGNRPEGRRDGNRDGRSFEGRRDGGNRFGGNRSQNGEGRPARQGEGNRGPRQNDGRGGNRFGGGANRGQGGQGGRFEGRDGGNRFGGGANRGQGGQGGRSEGGRGGDNRFGGQNRGGQGGARPGQRKSSSSDSVFTPELTKTSKDSKRERDRENKNKKKDFEKGGQGGRRPNQGGRRPNSRIPKALQKPNPQPKQEEKKPEIKEITIPEKLTIRELADAMKMQPSVIVKKLFMEGVMVTVNQEIDFDKAEEIALGFDIIAEKEEKVDVIAELLKEDEEDEDDMVPRPPVVCVMGHVDHGKTSLLDVIRKTNVIGGEAGGITQAIGAYQVKVNDRDITFLDTPGHEAFTQMRARGAQITDIAILVVAANDGVMPQTVEAINHAKSAGIPIIVAINKIDLPDANPQKVKEELMQYELVPEEWGGDTIYVEISAKKNLNIDQLLEMVLLEADVLELKANPTKQAKGAVIEARLDKNKGAIASVLVQRGKLDVGDTVVVGTSIGRIRSMVNDKGKKVKSAGPSTPVEIMGLTEVPQAGDIFYEVKDEKMAKHLIERRKRQAREKSINQVSAVTLDNLFGQMEEGKLKQLNLIVKADVQGSVEALKQSLEKLSNEEVRVKVIHSAAGAVTESDVTLAKVSNAIIIAFNVRPVATAKNEAEKDEVQIKQYSVIYQAIDDVEAAMKGMLDPKFEEEVIGTAEIRQIFKISNVGTIGGAMVLTGKIARNAGVRVIRDDVVIHDGKLISLKRFKDDAKEVAKDFECGIQLEKYNDIKEGDILEAYIMKEIKR